MNDEIHHLSVEGAFAPLQSGPLGLSSEEAIRGLSEFGHDELEEDTPADSAVFGTLPLPLDAWHFIFPFFLGLILLETARKWVWSRTSGRA